VTGHSLGGALASTFWLNITYGEKIARNRTASQGEKRQSHIMTETRVPSLITFGSPQVVVEDPGNEVGNLVSSRSGGINSRVLHPAHADDLIPNLQYAAHKHAGCTKALTFGRVKNNQTLRDYKFTVTNQVLKTLDSLKRGASEAFSTGMSPHAIEGYAATAEYHMENE